MTYTFRLWNKSLVIDTVALGGNVAEVRYGHAEGLDNPRLVTNPFYHYGYQATDRPAVAVSGSADKPLFLTGNTDWYLSNASVPFSVNAIKEGRTSYQGGVRYIHKTDGKRNDCFERFFVTLSPRYEEVLPTLPNPKSPYMHVAGTHVWRAHGAGDRKSDAAHWTNIWRYGMRECVITDHETGWRDGGESFTFRTKTAPGKGGDQGQFDYARLMQDKLGFVYGPYNNYTDFAPVNEFWSFDLISRTPDNQLQGAWMRCYAPKPARAVEYCAKLAPIIQDKFHFSTAYCDVHTAVAPWERVDYDRRVPGAGTFAATFYSYGEIMLHQKNAWKGPVYSEGNHHFYYSGLTDGNYAQDRGYDIPNNPWLVDLDLRKMHDLNCNFGMGAESMFYGENNPAAGPEDKDAYTDRFLAATVAFGHPGFLCSGGLDKTLRGYYMIQQLAASYTLSPVKSIGYVDEKGKAAGHLGGDRLGSLPAQPDRDGVRQRHGDDGQRKQDRADEVGGPGPSAQWLQRLDVARRGSLTPPKRPTVGLPEIRRPAVGPVARSGDRPQRSSSSPARTPALALPATTTVSRPPTSTSMAAGTSRGWTRPPPMASGSAASSAKGSGRSFPIRARTAGSSCPRRRPWRWTRTARRWGRRSCACRGD